MEVVVVAADKDLFACKTVEIGIILSLVSTLQSQAVVSPETGKGQPQPP